MPQTRRQGRPRPAYRALLQRRREIGAAAIDAISHSHLIAFADAHRRLEAVEELLDQRPHYRRVDRDAAIIADARRLHQPGAAVATCRYCEQGCEQARV